MQPPNGHGSTGGGQPIELLGKSSGKGNLNNCNNITLKPRQRQGKLTSQAIWKLRNPLAVRAHALVSQAIKSGKLKRLPCKRCGAEPADAHHQVERFSDAYERPLERLVFLCRRCHRRAHRLALKPKRGAA